MAIEESFMKSVFYGAVPEEMVFPYPELGKSEREDTGLIVESVRRFGETIDPVSIDREECLSQEILQSLCDLGLFGLNIPVEYGGKGLSATSYARVIEELSAVDASIALTVGAHQSIGLQGLLLFGTEAQKRRWLPRLATGELIAAYAFTEAGAGSDAAGIQTRAELSRNGDGYVIDGEKVFVTNGAIADLFTVFARTTAADLRTKPRITAFMVERQDGVRTGAREPTLGVRGATSTPLTLDRVQVSAENVLGEVGRGFKVAMVVLNSGRLGLAAGCVGIAKSLIRRAVERTQRRRAFGRPLSEFGMIKDKLAKMMVDTYALESMVYLTTGMVDARVRDCSVEVAICKVFGSEMLWRVADEALQIAAGAGYTRGQPFERLLRDARANLIFEGTNEILRAFIALSGMQGPSRKLTEMGWSLRELIKGFGPLYDFAIQQARTALGRAKMNRAHNSLRREVVVFEEYVGHFQKNVDKALRKHGRDIAEMQYTQRRVADIAIDLYGLAAVLARTTRAIERKGEDGAHREIELTAGFANMAEKRLQANVSGFDDNDDELRKAVAAQVVGDGGYGFDVL